MDLRTPDTLAWLFRFVRKETFMHDRKQLFQTENQKLTTYEGLFDAQKSVSKTDLAYRFMNTRFLDLEKSQSTEKEWSDKLREYRQTKKRIEKQWHQNTLTDTAKLSFFGDAEHSNKEKEYYSTFTLEQMEVLIKNHERGGNSDEYNDVVTDLELYNLVS